MLISASNLINFWQNLLCSEISISSKPCRGMLYYLIKLKENYFQHEFASHMKVGPLKHGKVCITEQFFLLPAFQLSCTKYLLIQINKEQFNVSLPFVNVQSLQQMICIQVHTSIFTLLLPSLVSFSFQMWFKIFYQIAIMKFIDNDVIWLKEFIDPKPATLIFC